MSIQDDIYDVRAALEGTPEAKQFERLEKFYYCVEQQHDTYYNGYKKIVAAVAILKELWDGVEIEEDVE